MKTRPPLVTSAPPRLLGEPSGPARRLPSTRGGFGLPDSFPKRHLPHKFPFIEVDCCQHRAWGDVSGRPLTLTSSPAPANPLERHFDERIGPIILADAIEPDTACCAHEQISTFGIERRATPVRAADLARTLKRAPERRRCKQGAASSLLARERVDLWRQIIGIIE